MMINLWVEGCKSWPPEDFKTKHKHNETIRLEQNYRSTSIILNAANALIENNQARLGKNLWTESNEGEQITLYQAFNEQDEARFVAEIIKSWMDGGELSVIQQ